MKIIFMGTPDFSAVVLKKLHEVYPVSAVVTGLDKPFGRGYKLKPSPLKEAAVGLNIPVFQFDKVSKEGLEEIRALEPDLIVTAAFGQILNDRFLDIPKFGVLNVHASLLPKYRGASPIQWAVLNGDSETGVSVMKTVKAVDAGDVLLKKSAVIGESETAGELFDRLAVLGGEAIVEAVTLVENGKAVFTPQDDGEATHVKMIEKADGNIDFGKTARELDCFVRGMTPWPSAYTGFYGKTLKIFKVEKFEDISFANPGEVIIADTKRGIIVGCRDGAVRLKTIQLEGSAKMSDTEFLRGHNIDEGYKF